jgi:hypothetical protein
LLGAWREAARNNAAALIAKHPELFLNTSQVHAVEQEA